MALTWIKVTHRIGRVPSSLDRKARRHGRALSVDALEADYFQLSFRVTMRLNTGLPGWLSTRSATK